MRWVVIGVSIFFIVIVALTVILLRTRGAALLGAFLHVPSAEQMYPPAPAMPPAVSTPVEDLLSEYEAFLASKAPAVLTALQPGLSDAEIDALEAKHGFKLTGDLRALYRWRNGTPRDANVYAFPDHWFVPLDVALAERDAVRQQVKAETPAQQRMYAAFAGHRDGWIDVIVDLAGDGHFFDPNRQESQGSFFYCFAEDGSYTFYPAFRNYLAAVVEGQKTGVFTASPQSVDTTDFAKSQAVWERYGASPQR